VFQNAIKATNKDARIPALEMQRLKELTLSKDVLTSLEITTVYSILVQYLQIERFMDKLLDGKI
jgi:hypothetical protein